MSASPPTSRKIGAWLGKGWVAVLLLAILGIGFYVRVAPTWSTVFPEEGETRFFDTDSYYHLRHAQFAARNFPHVQRQDIGTHYPRGQRAHLAGLFDLTIAATALVVGLGDAEPGTVEAVAVWLPPIMGILAIFVLFLVLRSLLGSAVGLLGCAIVSLYPATFLNRSFLAYADHHVAEVLLGLLLIWGLIRCLQNATGPSPRPWWRPAVLHALPLTALFFTWVGAPMYMVVLGVVLLLLSTLHVVAKQDTLKLAIGIARYGFGFMVVAAPLAYLWPELVMDMSLRKPALALGAGLALGVPLYLLTGRLLVRIGLPATIAAALLVSALGAAVWIILQLDYENQRMVQFALKAKTILVSEHSEVTEDVFWTRLGPPGLIALGALPIAMILTLFGRDRRFALVAVGIGTGVMFLWWQTHDYGYAVPPYSALLAAWVIGLPLRWFAGRAPAKASPPEVEGGKADSKGAALDGAPPARRLRLRPALAAGLGVASLAAMAIPVWPMESVMSPYPSTAQIAQVMIIDTGWVQALRWMEENTPQPTLPLDTRVTDERPNFRYPEGTYGVMAAWDFGSFINALGRRVPAASQGIENLTARWLLSTDERASLDTMRAPCQNGERFRYVALDARTLGDFFLAKVNVAGGSMDSYFGQSGVWQFFGHNVPLVAYNELYHRTIASRLYLFDANELSHYRLVYRSPHQSYLTYNAHLRRGFGGVGLQARRTAYRIDDRETLRYFQALQRRGGVIHTPLGFLYGGVILPTVKLFEVVEGATITGTGPPGMTVQAQIALRSTTDGAEIDYHKTTIVDDNGEFSLTIPYATEPADITAVHAVGPVKVYLVLPERDWTALLAEVDVTEEQVQNGATIEISSPSRL